MVSLPLNKPQNWFESLKNIKKSQAQDNIHFEWAVHQQGLLNKDAIKSNNSQQQIKLCFLNINNILKFIMINAEVVNHYQHYITKNIDSSILGVGYCNGMIGFIFQHKIKLYKVVMNPTYHLIIFIYPRHLLNTLKAV